MYVGYTHDFRNSTGRAWKDTWEDALFLMCEAARLGFDYVLVQEHFFTDDGYGPAPAVFMTALIERTSDIRIGTNSYVLPLHHPAALAQEIAVLDHLSGGRIEVTVALGHRGTEFAAFGFPTAQRVSRFEEGMEILNLAWTGEPFSYAGKRYRLTDLVVHPEPLQRPHPPLWVGATTTAAAERAGRYGAHLRGASLRPEFFDAYLRGLDRVGVDPLAQRISKSISFTVTDDDPNEVWQRNRAHYARRWGFYHEIRSAIGDPPLDSGLPSSPEPFREHELIGTPIQVLDTLADAVAGTPVTDIIYSGPASGIPARTEGLESLQRFAAEVMPALKTW